MEKKSTTTMPYKAPAISLQNHFVRGIICSSISGNLNTVEIDEYGEI